MKRVSLFIALFACLILVQNVHALAISPLRQTITLDPGNASVLRLDVINNTDTAKEIIGEVDAFVTDEETGAALFGQKDVALDWIQLPQASFSILPGETQVLTFPINVPENASAGSHYLGLFAREIPPSGDVQLSTRVGSLLFAYVGGTLDESLVRETFEFDGSLTQTERTVSISMKNTGDIHLAPQGTLVVENWKGEQLHTYSINIDGRNVTPGSRFVENFVVNKGTIGPVTARATVRYGVNDQEFTVLAKTWIVPIWFVVIVVGLCFIIVLASIIVRRYAKK